MGNNKSRVITYIDGFNLYFGLREKGWQKYMWLDLTKFSAALLLKNQALVETKYFTSRVSGNIEKQKRQSTYLDALGTLPGLQIFYGQYQLDNKQCRKCGAYYQNPQEKKNDVNIASEMLCDAFHDRFDTAILVSADSDLTAPLEAIKKFFPAKSVIVAYPPKRFSVTLQHAATASYHMGENKFKGNTLPSKVVLPSGYTLDCPDKYKC
jgi:uncharacterized LabA/DUF88 family protein